MNENNESASRAMLPVTNSRLTDEQIDRQWAMSCTYGGVTTQQFVRHFARAVLALATPVAGWVSVEKDAASLLPDIAQALRVTLQSAVLAQGSYGPKYDAEKLADGIKFLIASITTPAPVVTPTQKSATGLCANCDGTCADGEDCPAPVVTPTQQENK